MAAGKWFDGNIQCQKVEPLGGDLIQIHLTEYQNLKSECTTDSYYQCLAKRFEVLDFSKISDKKINGNKCPFKGLCSPYSLPYEENEIPHCEAEIDQICYAEVLEDLEKSQKDHCKKTCLAREFDKLYIRWGVELCRK